MPRFMWNCLPHNCACRGTERCIIDAHAFDTTRNRIIASPCTFMKAGCVNWRTYLPWCEFTQVSSWSYTVLDGQYNCSEGFVQVSFTTLNHRHSMKDFMLTTTILFMLIMTALSIETSRRLYEVQSKTVQGHQARESLWLVSLDQ